MWVFTYNLFYSNVVLVQSTRPILNSLGVFRRPIITDINRHQLTVPTFIARR